MEDGPLISEVVLSHKSLENCFIEEEIVGGRGRPWRPDHHKGLVRLPASVPEQSDHH
jgi:hypothetical protein